MALGEVAVSTFCLPLGFRRISSPNLAEGMPLLSLGILWRHLGAESILKEADSKRLCCSSGKLFWPGRRKLLLVGVVKLPSVEEAKYRRDWIWILLIKTWTYQNCLSNKISTGLITFKSYKTVHFCHFLLIINHIYKAKLQKHKYLPATLVPHKFVHYCPCFVSVVDKPAFVVRHSSVIVFERFDGY